MPARLNTTDFAILGLLSRQSWSAYELTQYMCSSNIRAVWPRAESRIYESPKKLVRLGFATSTKETQGKRSRAVYCIAPPGEEALQHWLDQDNRAFSFEYESMLKLALGDISDAGRRVARLEQLAQESEEDWQQLEKWFALFARGEEEEGFSGDRRVQNLMINSFIKELLDARRRWSEFAGELERDYAACSTEEQKIALAEQSYRRLLKNS